jgi:hypothetical protein
VPFKSEKQRRFMWKNHPKIAKKWEKKGKILILLLLVCGIASATNQNINDCGSYTVTTGNSLTLTANITASTGSTITNGACVYISVSQNPDIYLAGHSITNNGSSATKGIFIDSSYTTVTSSTITIANNTVITGFATGIEIASANTNPSETINFVSATSKTILNANYSVKITADSLAAVNGLSAICATNTPYVLWLNYSGTLTTNPTVAVSCNLNPTFVSDSLSAGPKFMYSNKIFTFNGAFDFNYTAEENGITYSGTLSKNDSRSAGVGTWYLNNPVVVFNSALEVNAYTGSMTSINSSNFKMYYCVSGLCNPYYFNNTFTKDFYMNFPDFVQTVLYSESYGTLKIWWIQGLTNYLTASSKNSEDKYFAFQQNGQFTFEVCNSGNCTNTTIINNCPSIYTICVLTIGANGTYIVAPIKNYNDLFTDVYWNISPSTRNNWITPENNNTFFQLYIVSVQNDLEYYGLTVKKYFNYSYTTVFNQTINTSTYGGTLNYTTNGTGRYDFYVFFKVPGIPIYTAPPASVWQGNATGLQALSQQLSSGTLISGWSYVLVSLIISVIAVIMLAGYTFTGAGIVGAVIFDVFAYLWPNAAVGVIPMWSIALITTVVTLFWAARQI